MAIAAGVIVALVLYDIVPDSVRAVGLIMTIGLFLAGVAVWVGLKTSLSQSASILPISLAIWLHSFLEGALAATSQRLDPHLGTLVVIGTMAHLIPEFLALTALLRYYGASQKQATVIYATALGILSISFGLFKFIMRVGETPLQILATVVAGGMIYLGVNTLYRLFKNRHGAYGQA